MEGAVTEHDITFTEAGRDLTRSSGHFVPRLFNATASDPMRGLTRQTAAAASQLVFITIPYGPTHIPEEEPGTGAPADRALVDASVGEQPAVVQQDA